METILNVPQGAFKIRRLPYRKNEKLRAWDAADEYLLRHLFEHVPLTEQNRVLILNDRFGALAIALNAYKPIALSDSWLSRQATKLNLNANDLSQNTIQFKDSLSWPAEKFDLVIIKVPKTLAFLEDQLIRLQALITENTVIIAAGMIKAMPAAVWKLLEKYIGPTKPSLAKKKARLIFTEIKSRTTFENPYPIHYQLENTEYCICNHANVFSRESLDIGTRFLLEHLPEKTNAKDIVDLGCGNGVVGLMLADTHPLSKLSFVDESYMAVASAKETFFHAFPDRPADFCIADGLADFKAESMDLIVCNPPFHQQSAVVNQIALSMFKRSFAVLRKGGELWVIGNRHLGYHIDLKRLFGVSNEIASNKKFVIWRVKK